MVFINFILIYSILIIDARNNARELINSINPNEIDTIFMYFQ